MSDGKNQWAVRYITPDIDRSLYYASMSGNPRKSRPIRLPLPLPSLQIMDGVNKWGCM